MKGLPPETILQLIEEAINYIDKQTPNFSWSGIANIKKYDACEDVILNHHQYKNKKTIEEYFNDLKCSDKFVKENILKPALNSLKHDKKVTIKRFNQKISEYETKEVSRDDNKWYFIFPVNFRLESKNGIQKEFVICDNVVQLLNYRDFRESEFWSNDVKKQLTNDSFFPDKSNLLEYSWAITNGEGKDWLFALNHSVKNLNRFLGAVNFSYWINMAKGFGNWSRYPETTGYTEIVTPSYVLQYGSNKQFEDLGHFEIGCAVAKYVVFRDGTTKEYQKLIAIFEDLNRLDKESEAYKVICEAFEIYNLALNKIGYDSGFLDLWTGLEKMTFRRREGRNDIPYPTIIKRLFGIMINPPEIIEIRLNEMLDKRHQLVHGGKYDIISRSDFNFLKWKYERVLLFLMGHNNEFKTIDEIEWIYDKSGKTKDELDGEVRVINYLIEVKEKLPKNREDEKS